MNNIHTKGKRVALFARREESYAGTQRHPRVRSSHRRPLSPLAAPDHQRHNLAELNGSVNVRYGFIIAGFFDRFPNRRRRAGW